MRWEERRSGGIRVFGAAADLVAIHDLLSQDPHYSVAWGLPGTDLHLDVFPDSPGARDALWEVLWSCG